MSLGLLLALWGVLTVASELSAPPTRAAAEAEERRIEHEAEAEGGVAIAAVSHRDLGALLAGLAMTCLGVAMVTASVRGGGPST